MKLITRDTDYAIRALVFIAGRGDSMVSVPELVRELRIPRPFLRKLLQMLSAAGILRSFKGIGGGFRIVRPASSIYITDVIKVFQGDLKINECIFKKKVCPNKKVCMLRKELNVIEQYAANKLGSLTLSKLIKEK
jgi:Rrf2 family protein